MKEDVMSGFKNINKNELYVKNKNRSNKRMNMRIIKNINGSAIIT